MDYLQNILSDEVIYALGWTVLHSLWQGALVALLTLVLLSLLQKRSAELRYWLSNIALYSTFALAIGTFFYYYQPASNSLANTPFLPFFEGEINDETSHWTSFFSTYFNQHLPLIVSLWLVGMAFFTLRLAGGLVYIQHLKYNQQQALSAIWQTRLADLQNAIFLKKTIRLAESALVKVPMVIGFLKPVILLPIGAVNQLSVAQVEAILAHELAHIKRHDYLLNIVQSLIETVLYFNPAVWIISAHIRAERENCCDDIAVHLCGNSLTYAKALVHLQEINHAAPLLAMAFSSKKKHLLPRIQRILNQPQNKSQIMEKLIATMTVFTAILCFSFSSTAFEKQVAKAINVDVEVEEISMKNEDAKVKVIRVMKDSIPAQQRKESHHIVRNENGKKTELKMTNGEIEKLKIDGKTIDKADYPKYEAEVADIIDNIPPPPPAPPTPPSPPSMNGIPTPPTSPTPPAAPNAPLIRVKKMKGGNGSTFMIIDENDNGMLLGEPEKRALIIDTDVDENALAIELQTVLEILENVDVDKELIRTKVQNALSSEGLTTLSDDLIFDGVTNRIVWLDTENDENDKFFWKTDDENSFTLIEGNNKLIIEKDDFASSLPLELNGFSFSNDLASDVIIRELKKDGFVKNGSYKVALTNKWLKINGKKQSATLHKKYQKLYEKATKSKLKGKSKIQWQHKEY